MTWNTNSSVAFAPGLSRKIADVGWARVDLLDEVDSTNAAALAEPEAWRLVAAHHQSAGRGRLDRQWQTPPGSAVTVSMTLPLPAEPTAWGWAPLFVGDAVRAALAELAESKGAEAQFATKWPNDVLARDADGEWRKICGVLCQVASGDLVVAGVGVNVTQGRDELPVDTATSAALVGLDVTRDDVLLAVSTHVLRAARAWREPEQGEAMRERVRAHCRTIGRLIDVHTSTGVERCEGAGIDETGRLLARVPGAHPGSAPTMTYSVADVVHARLGAEAHPSDAGGEA